MLEIRTNELLAPYTTLKVGGRAQYFAVLKSKSDVSEAIFFAKENSLAVYVIGGGSNLLINDDGIDGLVLKNEIVGIEYREQGNSVIVEAKSGVVLDDLIIDVVDRGYWGLENLSHIPGTVGATPIQNVGAYGLEVSSIIESVETIDMRSGETVIFTNADCAFGYRDSFFKTEEGKIFLVISVRYRLDKDGAPNISYRDVANYFSSVGELTQQVVRGAVIDIRGHKFPNWHVVGTAGSFFKNPIIEKKLFLELKKNYPDLPGFEMGEDKVKVPLGWILDHVIKVKGYRSGQVGTYEGQALVLINHGGATAAEFLNFSDNITTQVFVATGIQIEREVTALP